MKSGTNAPMVFDRISTSPDRMAGVPCIRDLRFPVATVVAMVADGMTHDEILREHPDLELDDISAALSYPTGTIDQTGSRIAGASGWSSRHFTRSRDSRSVSSSRSASRIAPRSAAESGAWRTR
ncbi:MAG: DUF433 domain-containing protein [Candidatus Microthrix sp.]|nr:DUF433 domain-containing protein [Candidatus Microthrix sp.]